MQIAPPENTVAGVDEYLRKYDELRSSVTMKVVGIGAMFKSLSLSDDLRNAATQLGASIRKTLKLETRQKIGAINVVLALDNRNGSVQIRLMCLLPLRAGEESGFPYPECVPYIPLDGARLRISDRVSAQD